MLVLSAVADENAEAVVKKAALAADQALVLATPVDTGRARSNWIASVDIPVKEVRAPYAAGQGLGRGEGANARGALEQAREEISKYEIGTHRRIVISNNVPYIETLNNGHSAQAPSGFIEKAIQQATTAIRGARILRKGGV
jgi:hypothetical protein